MTVLALSNFGVAVQLPIVANDTQNVSFDQLCGAVQAPKVARDYWKLGEDAKMRDLLLAVRADEACHSHVNHTFSTMKNDEKNPFNVGTHHVPQA